MKKILYFLPLLLLYACSDLELQTSQFPQESQQFSEVEPMPDAEIVNMFELNRVLRNSSEVSECVASRSSKEYTISNVNDDNGVPLVYVINYKDNAGFVIISARKSGQPVLAFGDEGSFNPQQNEEMASEWLHCVAIKVDSLSNTDSEEARMHKLMWRTYEKSSELQSSRATIHELENKLMDFNSYLMSHGRTLYTLTDISFKDSSKAEMLRDMLQNGWMYYEYVDYMESLTTIAEYDSVRCVETPNVIKTTWGQTGGYNQSYPPVGSLAHAYAGCTSVAAGQIMYYYRHPSTFDWDAMFLNQGTKATSDMLYAITASSNPSYSESGTGIALANMAQTLIKNGYNATHKGAFTEYSITIPCIIHNKMFSKLKNDYVHHAWIISGKKQYAYQHRFEMWTYTGYETIGKAYTEVGETTYKNFYYVNWGWNGSNNGWFGDISTVCPNSNYSSSTMQQMIVNIYPK